MLSTSILKSPALLLPGGLRICSFEGYPNCHIDGLGLISRRRFVPVVVTGTTTRRLRERKRLIRVDEGRETLRVLYILDDNLPAPLAWGTMIILLSIPRILIKFLHSLKQLY